MNAWWQEVVDTLQAEFSDITDTAHLTRVTIRLLIAAIQPTTVSARSIR